MSLIRAVLRRDGIALNIDVPKDLPPAPCPPTQLQQILMNLVTNARDAVNLGAPDGVREIGVKAEVANAPGGGREVRLLVSDTGAGVASDALPRIFDPFFTTKPRAQGTGLGLSVSHGIVTELGGRIEVETRPGHTTFRVCLPLDEVS